LLNFAKTKTSVPEYVTPGYVILFSVSENNPLNSQGTDMWPVIWNFMRINAPYLTLPFAAAIGVIGYGVEGLISDKFTPFKTKSVEEERDERLLKELDGKDVKTLDSLKDKKFVPRSIFEKNVSPSLQKTNV